MITINTINRYTKRSLSLFEAIVFASMAYIYILEDLFGTSKQPHIISITNALLQRAGNVGEHDISWIMIFIFALYCRIKLKPKWENLLLSGILLGFMIGLAEETWNIVFYINTWPYTNPMLYVIGQKWYIFFTTTVALVIGIITKSYRYFDKRKLMFTLLTLFSYFAFWSVIGFPTTVSYYGITPYYHNIYVNLLEVLHWTIASITLMWAFTGEQSIKQPFIDYIKRFNSDNQ